MDRAYLRPLAACIIFAVCITFFCIKTDAAASTGSAASCRMIQQNLFRGALACYASEGAYPATLEYLCENYGISYDSTRYAVYYEIFASNIMPQISVVELCE